MSPVSSAAASSEHAARRLGEPPEAGGRTRARCSPRSAPDASAGSREPVACGGELEQRERVAGRRAGSSRSSASCGTPARRRSSAASGRVEPGDAQDAQVRAVEQRRLALAHGEHDRDRIGDQPARGEQQRLGAGAVEPVRVVDEHERPAPSSAQPTSRLSVAAPTAKRSWAVAGPSASAPASALACGARDPVERGQRRAQQLGEPGERNLGLRLDPARAQHPHPVGLRRRVLEQRRLADAGLADEREHAAATRLAPAASSRSSASRSSSRPSSMRRFCHD